MTLRDDRIAFIGCGMMGEALIKGLLHEKLVEPTQIVASHPRPERLRELSERYGIRTLRHNDAATEGATMVALAPMASQASNRLAGVFIRPGSRLLLSTVTP